MAAMSKKMGAYGGGGGSGWDDGAYLGIRKVFVGRDFTRITYVKFEYDNGDRFETRDHGKIQQQPQEFALDYPNEYITSVEGTYRNVKICGGTDVVTSLAFKTSKGRTSPRFGSDVGTRFVIEDKGRRIVGFHGRTGNALDSLGAYFARVSSISYPIKELDAQGGNGGDLWDDDTYDGVRKVYVGRNDHCVTYVKFDYDKGGLLESRDHGRRAQSPIEFVLDYPEEYITSVEGTYSFVGHFGNTIVTSLSLKTSKQRASPLVGIVTGTKFVLEDKGGKLIGFHGRSGHALDALGAYFVPSSLTPPYKSHAKGGSGGNAWDDGTHDGIRKVYAGRNNSDISYVKFEYDKAGKFQAHDHGKIVQQPIEFALDYPNEHITEVEGTFRNVVTSLSFKTSKKRTSPTFGVVSGTKFVLEGKGSRIVGFHGRAGDAVDSLGAYFGPIISRSKKLEAHGGNVGTAWDDGPHDGVRKIYVGQGDSGVVFVKFVYDKGEKVVAGDDHGKKTLLGTEEFELDYPDEYITSVIGRYDKIAGIQGEIITVLRFKTNKRTSPPFGLDAGTEFVLEEKGSKIVGFHGKASDVVHQVGVHVLPISN
ncbi:PREDICTED: jacalin-related lectin 23-like [Tarenaya hassleriana]|uniref:jacalin-related lectin 23-like n=1 Tax=Tarenaya hassleriana TaxID=28532 RepID=UPI00053C51C8|nr:PREDICTED: jacalin-related lectin 23-like [Tarenaya hassleriana]